VVNATFPGSPPISSRSTIASPSGEKNVERGNAFRPRNNTFKVEGEGNDVGAAFESDPRIAGTDERDAEHI